MDKLDKTATKGSGRASSPVGNSARRVRANSLKDGNVHSIKSRFIDETTRLMRKHGIDGVSTRAICDAVGVTAPSLYHHFGDFQSLQETVVANAFSTFLDRWSDSSSSGDPLTRVRGGWDSHVAFSQDEPELHSIIAMLNVSGQVPNRIKEAHELVIRDFSEIAETCLLNYSPALAAQIITAGSLGVSTVMSLQKRGLAEVAGLSAAMREDALRGIFASPDCYAGTCDHSRQAG